MDRCGGPHSPMVSRDSPVIASHTRMVSSLKSLTTRFPSARKATASTPAAWVSRVARGSESRIWPWGNEWAGDLYCRMLSEVHSTCQKAIISFRKMKALSGASSQTVVLSARQWQAPPLCPAPLHMQDIVTPQNTLPQCQSPKLMFQENGNSLKYHLAEMRRFQNASVGIEGETPRGSPRQPVSVAGIRIADLPPWCRCEAFQAAPRQSSYSSQSNIYWTFGHKASTMLAVLLWMVADRRITG
jgi:hypothetical protein